MKKLILVAALAVASVSAQANMTVALTCGKGHNILTLNGAIGEMRNVDNDEVIIRGNWTTQPHTEHGKINNYQFITVGTDMLGFSFDEDGEHATVGLKDANSKWKYVKCVATDAYTN